MQRVGPVIGSQRIIFALQLKMTFGDPVAIATDDGAEISIWLMNVFADAVVTQHHVSRFSILVGHNQADHTRAIVGDGNADFLTLQDIQGSGLAVDGVTESRRVGKLVLGEWLRFGVRIRRGRCRYGVIVTAGNIKQGRLSKRNGNQLFHIAMVM